jgi:hypothetical protein
MERKFNLKPVDLPRRRKEMNYMKRISIVLVCLFAFGCATTQVPQLKPYTPSASDVSDYRMEAERLLNEEDWVGARINYLRALDADRSLINDKSFMAGFLQSVEKSDPCNACKGGK